MTYVLGSKKWGIRRRTANRYDNGALPPISSFLCYIPPPATAVTDVALSLIGYASLWGRLSGVTDACIQKIFNGPHFPALGGLPRSESVAMRGGTKVFRSALDIVIDTGVAEAKTERLILWHGPRKLLPKTKGYLQIAFS